MKIGSYLRKFRAIWRNVARFSGPKPVRTHVRATSDDQSKLAIYAAQRSNDDALTHMVISKTEDELTSPIQSSQFTQLNGLQSCKTLI